MRSRLLLTCAQPGCYNLQPCPEHAKKPSTQPSASSRGYGSRWQQIRKAFLAANPLCAGNGTGSHHPHCDGKATIPDHHPLTRAELVRQGVADPDAFHRLVPRSDPCHKSITVRFDGGWGNPKKPRPPV